MRTTTAKTVLAWAAVIGIALAGAATARSAEEAEIEARCNEMGYYKGYGEYPSCAQAVRNRMEEEKTGYQPKRCVLPDWLAAAVNPPMDHDIGFATITPDRWLESVLGHRQFLLDNGQDLREVARDFLRMVEHDIWIATRGVCHAQLEDAHLWMSDSPKRTELIEQLKGVLDHMGKGLRELAERRGID